MGGGARALALFNLAPSLPVSSFQSLSLSPVQAGPTRESLRTAAALYLRADPAGLAECLCALGLDRLILVAARLDRLLENGKEHRGGRGGSPSPATPPPPPPPRVTAHLLDAAVAAELGPGGVLSPVRGGAAAASPSNPACAAGAAAAPAAAAAPPSKAAATAAAAAAAEAAAASPAGDALPPLNPPLPLPATPTPGGGAPRAAAAEAGGGGAGEEQTEGAALGLAAAALMAAFEALLTAYLSGNWGALRSVLAANAADLAPAGPACVWPPARAAGRGPPLPPLGSLKGEGVDAASPLRRVAASAAADLACAAGTGTASDGEDSSVADGASDDAASPPGPHHPTPPPPIHHAASEGASLVGRVRLPAHARPSLGSRRAGGGRSSRASSSPDRAGRGGGGGPPEAPASTTPPPAPLPRPARVAKAAWRLRASRAAAAAAAAGGTGRARLLTRDMLGTRRAFRSLGEMLGGGGGGERGGGGGGGSGYTSSSAAGGAGGSSPPPPSGRRSTVPSPASALPPLSAAALAALSPATAAASTPLTRTPAATTLPPSALGVAPAAAATPPPPPPPPPPPLPGTRPSSHHAPTLLLLGGGMAAGKSTVRDLVGRGELWGVRLGASHGRPPPVIIEADAIKATAAAAVAAEAAAEAALKAMEGSGGGGGGGGGGRAAQPSTAAAPPPSSTRPALVHRFVHEYSTAAAEALLVQAINAQRDVIFDGTMAWAPFVEATVAMARDHGRSYRRGPGYRGPPPGAGDAIPPPQAAGDGSCYWEPVGPAPAGARPYRIELVGVTCDPALAVARGLWRAVRTGRSVPPASLLRSHRLFAATFERVAPLVDAATLFHTGRALTTLGKPASALEPGVVAHRSAATRGEMLVRPVAWAAFRAHTRLVDAAGGVGGLYGGDGAAAAAAAAGDGGRERGGGGGDACAAGDARRAALVVAVLRAADRRERAQPGATGRGMK